MVNVSVHKKTTTLLSLFEVIQLAAVEHVLRDPGSILELPSRWTCDPPHGVFRRLRVDTDLAHPTFVSKTIGYPDASILAN